MTNNSIQKKYKPKQNRDPRLPKNNMWSLQQFKTYLKQQDKPNDIWEKKIYAGIKENLIAVVMVSMEETEIKENAFEMYGCDFMLDEKFRPILIEINSTPDLSNSTDVTASLCPRAMEDLVKVVVDKSRNPRASTGDFELIYNITYKNRTEHDPNTLNVNGTHMSLSTPPATVTVKKNPFKRLFRRPTIRKDAKNEKQKGKKPVKIIVSFLIYLIIFFYLSFFMISGSKFSKFTKLTFLKILQFYKICQKL